MCVAGSVAFDKSGNLWVADELNNRVLKFNAPLFIGEAASLVIGQQVFTTYFCTTSQRGLCEPEGIAFDKSGSLWVADTGNSRLVKFSAPFSNGELASTVLGQSTFTTSACTTTAGGFCYPQGLGSDLSGNLWAADTNNCRIVRFNAPTTNGESASVVIGQPTFTTNTCDTTQSNLTGPVGTALDKSGNLWVADFGNNRVLRFDTPFSNGESASLVIGQGSFFSSSCSTTQSGLCDPVGIAFDKAGNLWVADQANSRVLQFTVPLSSAESASLVLGKPDFTTSGCTSTSSGFCNTEGLVFDKAGNLWIADQNSRVLGFLRFLDGELASKVLGQSGFTTGTCSTTQSGLCKPGGTTFDKSGNLWVADFSNNRVVMFKTPQTTDKAATFVIGQSSFTSSACATTQSGLCGPAGTAFDSSGNLWVADGKNNRVLEFSAPFSTGESASLVIGQSLFTTSGCATTRGGLCTPTSVAFDKSGNLWVADEANNRILKYSAPFSNGELASLVIGQSLFTTSACAQSPSTESSLCLPFTIVFDKSGNLWVADAGNSRVLMFRPPFSNDEAAFIVIGQADFTTSTCALNQSGMCNPDYISFDPSGNLWVADSASANSRVLEFLAPYCDGEPASFVIGHPDFTSSGCALTQSGLCNPDGLAFDKSGNLWVGDFTNNRVIEFT